MEIQVNEQIIARWQCELCDDVITWLEYRQSLAWMWPLSVGSSETSTHSGSVAPAVLEPEDTADPPHVPEPNPTA
eukprot:6835147-Heterocapsa_arctica.AAC.1